MKTAAKALALAGIPFIGLALSGAANAESDTFKQQILPLDCVFTIINAGTGELQYLTPKQCGVVVNPPAGSTAAGQPLSQLQLNGFFQAASGPSQSGGSRQTGISFPPYQPLLKVQPQSANASDNLTQSSHLVPGAIIGGALIAAVILLVII